MEMRSCKFHVWSGGHPRGFICNFIQRTQYMSSRCIQAADIVVEITNVFNCSFQSQKIVGIMIISLSDMNHYMERKYLHQLMVELCKTEYLDFEIMKFENLGKGFMGSIYSLTDEYFWWNPGTTFCEYRGYLNFDLQ